MTENTNSGTEIHTHTHIDTYRTKNVGAMVKNGSICAVLCVPTTTHQDI